jgi:predicted chitinase
VPSEYEALVAALKLTDTPVAEYGWKTRPEGAYYVVQLDFESGQLNGDGEKLERSWEGSLDLFYPKLTDRDDLIEETEEILAEIFGSSWELNSTQYESGTGLFHVEWVFEALDTPQDEPEGDD